MGEEKLNPPSELFEDILRCAGNLVTDCSLCNRTHFATLNPGVYDEGELDDLLEKAKKEPDKYIKDPSNDGIAIGMLSGNSVVLGCPCNRLRKYEDFIWDNRRVIIEYLKKRAKVRKEKADADIELTREM